MKVLGNNSLSEKVYIGLNVVIILTIFIMLLIATILIKDVRDIINLQYEKISETILVASVFIAGFLFIFMLLNLTKFFKNLKNNICFDTANISLLNKIDYLILGGSIIYTIMAIFQIFFSNNYISIFTYNLFLWILVIIMLCLFIGLKIFIEIFKKAIEFKEENDFTI